MKPTSMLLIIEAALIALVVIIAYSWVRGGGALAWLNGLWAGATGLANGSTSPNSLAGYAASPPVDHFAAPPSGSATITTPSGQTNIPLQNDSVTPGPDPITALWEWISQLWGGTGPGGDAPPQSGTTYNIPPGWYTPGNNNKKVQAL